MGRRKRVVIDRGDDPLYLMCEYTDPTKARNTRHQMRVWVAWCSLRCEHKCLQFSTIPEGEITRNIKLLVERHGDKYLDDMKSFDLNKKIYKKCILCANDCKKEGIGILISCIDFKSSGRRRVTKALVDEANKILDKSENLTDIKVEEKPKEEKPKKRGRGRPKGSKNKPKKGVKKNGKKQTSRKKTATSKRKKTVKKGQGTKKTSTRKVSRKPKSQRSKKTNTGLVKTKGKIKSIRKVRGKNLFRLTVKKGRKEFQFVPTGPRSPVNKYLMECKDLWGTDISKCTAIVTMKNKKLSDVDIQQ